MSDDPDPDELFQSLNIDNIKSNQFVSGWDDADDLIHEDEHPHETPEREILWATDKGEIDIVKKILVENPQAVHAVDSDGYTPLHRACYNNFFDIVCLLLKNGANVNALTEMKWTPLHSACKWNNYTCVQLLLDHGADPNALSEGGQTPLHIAASVTYCRHIVMALLGHPDIQPDLLNNANERAVDIAKRSGLSSSLFEMAISAFTIETGLID